MDPITHTFTGAALAAAGLRRATPLATAALVLGANAPDVDVITAFSDGFASLAFRRGWTHGVLALPLWPFVLTGLLLLWDRWVRLRRNPHAAPARAGPLLALTTFAVLTHPTLDWLNNYGLRWLMPFDGTWFYGDALFIIDPWVWLTLGGVLFLRHSNRRLSVARWTVFWAIALLAMLANGLPGVNPSDIVVVPLPARVLWVAGLAALVAVRVRRSVGRRAAAVDGPSDRAFAAALAIVALYICATVAASAAARAQVRAALAAGGIPAVREVMVAPVAANPFAGEVVAATADAYYTGRWNWLAQPRFELSGEPLPRPRGDVFEAASRAHEAQQFLSWARFPVVEIERNAESDGFVARFGDTRYLGPAARRPDRAAGSQSLDQPSATLDARLTSAALGPPIQDDIQLAGGALVATDLRVDHQHIKGNKAPPLGTMECDDSSYSDAARPSHHDARRAGRPSSSTAVGDSRSGPRRHARADRAGGSADHGRHTAQWLPLLHPREPAAAGPRRAAARGQCGVRARRRRPARPRPLRRAHGLQRHAALSRQAVGDFMQSLGMRFGAHVNAHTGFDETVYELQVPTDNPAVIEQVAAVLEDFAHNVTFDPREIDKERGVILEEWRLGLGAGRADPGRTVPGAAQRLALRRTAAYRQARDHPQRQSAIGSSSSTRTGIAPT